MKIHEFRRSLKACFDAALAGESVVIERGGVKYQLIADGVFPSHVKSYSPGVTEVPGGRVVVSETQITQSSRFDGPLCKVHQLPLDDRGRCLQKGCKYA